MVKEQLLLLGIAHIFTLCLGSAEIRQTIKTTHARPMAQL